MKTAISKHATWKKLFPSLEEICKTEFGKQVPVVAVVKMAHKYWGVSSCWWFWSWSFRKERSGTNSPKYYHEYFCKQYSKNNLHIGLDLFLYNTVRKVIDLVYSMGFSGSYNDVSSITTALAEKTLSTDPECYKPYGLKW